MADLPAGIDSSFRFILIAAKRAEQLIGGARPRVTSRHVKPTTIALDELQSGAVPWRKMTADEYDLMRQQQLVETEVEEVAPLFPLPIPVLAIVAEAEVDAVVVDEDFKEDLDEAEFEDDIEDVEAVAEAVSQELLGEALPE